MESGDYQNAGNFADDYLVTSLLRKSENLPTGVDTAAVALGKFYSAEKHCSETNERLCDTSLPHPGWFRKWRREFAAILGPLDAAALERIVWLGKHGSGASIGVKGDGLVASDKYEKPLTVTEELLPFYETLVGETWAEYRPRQCAKVVRGNKFFTVPKDATTDRGACTEPTLNVYFQLGIGRYIAERLKRFGVDISSQEWNQALAEFAFEWQLATVDLSQASDLMSWSAVMEVADDDWFHLLSLASCRYTSVPDGNTYHDVELEKFCSMGNGFTFPLETAMFLAMVRVFVPPKDLCVCAVYGDDMIVPQAYARDLIGGLEYVGFKVNTRKSFLAGCFYESCGTDWFKSQNVRPFFLRRSEEQPGVPYSLQMLNSLRIWAKRRTGGDGCDQRFKRLWIQQLGKVPYPWNQCRVPALFGDTGVIVSESEGLKRSKPVADGYERLFSGQGPGWEGYRVRHVHMKTIEVDRRCFGIELAILHAIDGRDDPGWVGFEGISSKGREPRRGYLGIPKLTWSTLQEWTSGYEWRPIVTT
jgi:hypothetical protein